MKKAHEISCQQNSELQKGNVLTVLHTQYCCKQSPYWKCWEEVSWCALRSRELRLEASWWRSLGSDQLQSAQTYGVKSQPVYQEMKWQVNSENLNVDMQTCNSKYPWRRRGMNTRRRASESNEQLQISAPSKWLMSSVSTSLPTWWIVGVNSTALERWCNNQASLIYGKKVHLSVPKQFLTSLSIISKLAI